MKRPILIAVIGYIIGIIVGLYFKISIVPFYIPIIATYIKNKKMNFRFSANMNNKVHFLLKIKFLNF